jgi:hypothetical protein
MSANQSHLSNGEYRCDVVVATTEASLNTTIKSFLAKLREPLTTVCFVAAPGENIPVRMDYEELKKKANGSDPFQIPNGANLDTSKDLQNLRDARFMVGFRARIGIPKKANIKDIPELLILGRHTKSVTFNLLCSEFTILVFEPGGWGPVWTRISQPDEDPWIFESKVDLRLSVADQSAYGKLPRDLQTRIAQLGDSAFSVQQLLVDLSNAALSSVPKIARGIAPGTNVYEIISQYFLGAYFAQMRVDGEPLLGAVISRRDGGDRSTIPITGLNFGVCPYLDANGSPIEQPTDAQRRLTTLCTLGATDNHVLPPPHPFGWNWVDLGKESDYHGVISISREKFVSYLNSELQTYVQSNCYQPKVVLTWTENFAEYATHFTATPKQMPTLNKKPGELLSFSHQASSRDELGLNGFFGHLEIKTTFDLDVIASANTITITQRLVFYLDALLDLQALEGNLVDKKITDTFTLGVTSDGKLDAKRVTRTEDKSVKIDVGAFHKFIDHNQQVVDYLQRLSERAVSTTLKEIPLSIAQDFIFPGGRTFAFKDASFSDQQDLVAYITYADPT